MKAVYRQLLPQSAQLFAALLLAIVGGCGRGAPAPVSSPAAPLHPRPFALADFLSSTASTAIDLARDGGLALAGSSEGRGFLLDFSTGEATPLAPGGRTVPVRFFPADRRVLCERFNGASGSAPQLLILGTDGRISAPLPSWRAQGRFLRWSSDGSGYFLARTLESSPQEELVLISVRGALPQTLYVAQAGFRIAAVAARGERVALVRELDPDTTEVLLHDRARAETRLLLPLTRDGRFLPQTFSADGRRLYLFSDEGGDRMQLEILEPDTGERQLRARPGCDAGELDPAEDGGSYSLQWNCAGAAEAGLFETLTGAELGTLPLPEGTRVVRALPAGGSGKVLYEIAGGRFPRDLMLAARADRDARARPLTFGLAAAISAEDLVEPTQVYIRRSAIGDFPAELWWPRGALPHPAALLWLEDDARPPAWREFHPFLQFLANRGVVVLRLRLRGAQGFGRRFRHAADGRLVDAGLEDLEAAWAELTRRGVDARRVALLGEGPWSGALAATQMVERSGRFVAVADLGGDPDPMRQLDLLSALAEPARAWWASRLGDPAAGATHRDRLRMQFSTNAVSRRLFVAVDPQARVWSAEATAARLALEPANRIDLAPGTETYAGLDTAAITALWNFLRTPLATAP